MPEGYYRTGTAAQLLGVSPYHLRRLFEAGMVHGELLRSGQWQISVSEVERLIREGVPPIPSGIRSNDVEAEEWAPADNWRGDDQLHAVVEEAPRVSAEVAASADKIAIAQNELEKRKIDLDRARLEDQFQAREKRQAEEEAVREAGQREQWEQARELRRQRDWREEWNHYALTRLPKDAPPEAKLHLIDRMKEVLSNRHYSEACSITRALVKAAVEESLGPYKRQKETEWIVREAVARLPERAKGFLRPSDWETRAQAQAHQSIRQLGKNASVSEIRVAALKAVEAVMREFQHEQTTQQIISQVFVTGLSADDQLIARDMAKELLESLPVGTSEVQMKAFVSWGLQEFRQGRALPKDTKHI